MAMVLLAVIFTDKYNKLNQENLVLKDSLKTAAHEDWILKREYEKELKQRLRLKNRYDIIKEEKGGLEAEIVKQEALMAEVKELAEKNKELKDEIKSLGEDYGKKLKGTAEELEAAMKKREELEQENLKLQKEKQGLQQKNRELEKSFKNLEWMNPKD